LESKQQPLRFDATDKRAITAEEHAAIVAREQNAERRDFYELLGGEGFAGTA
jgi:hypothetical protein